MEVIALALLKTLATTCLKFYLSYLFTSGGIIADKGDLGYSIPSWYMNPGSQATAFYSYGTSTEGDEFASIDDARQKAIDQMIDLIKRSHQRIIKEEIRYDANDVKQRRLVELFLRGDNLNQFILSHASLDKKQIVKVTKPESELRAFVRLKLSTEDYIKNQEETIHELRKRLTYQKSENIMEEMSMEMENLRTTPAPSEGEALPPPGDAPDASSVSPSPIPPGINPPASRPASPGASVFDSMNSELDNITADPAPTQE